MHSIGRRILLGALSTILAPVAALAQQYRVIDTGMRLGIGSGDTFSLNRAGDVAGTSNTTQDGWHHGFQLSETALTDLGTLGGIQSFANAINNSGQVVGQADTGAAGCAWESHPVLWENGVATDLGTLGGPVGVATAIDDVGRIVGSSWASCSGPVRAFLWSDGRMRDLGSLVFGGSSWANSINSSGHIGGQVQVQFGNVFHAGLSIDGQWTELAGIPGCDESRAYRLNDSDQAVGSCNTPYRGDYRAVLWDRGEGIELGTLGGAISLAKGINNLGQIVGAADAVHGRHAFLFDSGTMLDLNDLIPPGSGWILVEANDINDDGVIVGWGLLGSARAVFLLQPTP
jgi:probable HAF family extracellular repeat protein